MSAGWSVTEGKRGAQPRERGPALGMFGTPSPSDTKDGAILASLRPERPTCVVGRRVVHESLKSVTHRLSANESSPNPDPAF